MQSNVPQVNDYILLPQGTMPAPSDGILYARIVEEVFLASDSRFNMSSRKKKAGWRISIYMNPITELEVPKSLVITTVLSSVLALELTRRPRELLGIHVAKGLADTVGDTYINYGQVVDLGPENEDHSAPRGYLVTFRPLADGTELEDRIFTEEETTDNEVTLEQYVLGLGVGKILDDPEQVAARYGDTLATFDVESRYTSWIKNFNAIVIAPPTCIVLDKYLRPTELDVDNILKRYTGLAKVVSEAMGRGMAMPVLDRALGDEFEAFSVEHQPSEVNELEVKLADLGINGITPVKTPMRARNGIRQAMRQTAAHAAAARGGNNVEESILSPSSTFDPSTLKHQQVANKLAYVPTEVQMHKHSVTFRSGVYGKSNTRIEHMGGVEIVFEVETQLATSRAMAQVRAVCIMQGAIHLVPFTVWESADAVAFTFEENAWEPIKWTKSPELVLKHIDDLDHFWRLYNQMQLAAGRYYVESYGRVLEHVRQNVQAGLMQFGAKEQFDKLTYTNRVASLQCVIKYMRAVMAKFMNQVLLPQAAVTATRWIAGETTQGELFFGLVASRWRTIQLEDVRNAASRSTDPPKHVNKRADDKGDVKSSSDKNNSLGPLRAMIPTENGLNICLVDYTVRGCRSKKCTYSPRTPSSPALDPKLQKWLEKNHGRYKE